MLATVVILLAVSGDLAFALWLVIKGVAVDKWKARAREASSICDPATETRPTRHDEIPVCTQRYGPLSLNAIGEWKGQGLAPPCLRLSITP